MGIRLGIFVLSILFVAFLSGALDFPANISLITSISLWIPAPIFLRFGFQAVQSVMSLPEDFEIRPKHHLQGENIIFVSYRREDSQAWADRIADDLKQSFGSKAVFQDVEAVPPGRDFREHLRSQLARCQLMLVVMGPEWVGAKYTSGSRRLDDEQDWVRVEIEIALQRSLPIIPVLAGKATMPSPESLPAAIRPLAFKTALPIRANPDFRNDMDRLISETRIGGVEEHSAAPCSNRSKWWQVRKRPRLSTHFDKTLPSQSEAEAEPVLLGASAPKKVTQGTAFTARFVAYTPKVEKKIGRMLASLAPDSSTHLALKTCRWKWGTDVVVQLSGQYLEVQSPTQTFKWEGKHSLLDFDVTVAANAPPGTTTLKYDVSIHGVIVARIRLGIRISRMPSFGKVRVTALRPAVTAFASYASMDRQRVLDRVAAVEVSAGLDIWIDCLSLNPGEQWKPRLREEICNRDLFLLFWSHHAKDSPWVSWEWHTALEQKGDSAFQLHPLETVQEAPPPEELKHLHFGDANMLLRKALE